MKNDRNRLPARRALVNDFDNAVHNGNVEAWQGTNMPHKIVKDVHGMRSYTRTNRAGDIDIIVKANDGHKYIMPSFASGEATDLCFSKKKKKGLVFNEKKCTTNLADGPSYAESNWYQE